MAAVSPLMALAMRAAASAGVAGLAVLSTPAMAEPSKAPEVIHDLSVCDAASIPDFRQGYEKPPQTFATTTASDGTTTTVLNPPLHVGGIDLTQWTEIKANLGNFGGFHDWGFTSPQPLDKVRDALLGEIANASDLLAHNGYIRMEYFNGSSWVTVRGPTPDGHVLPEQYFDAPTRAFSLEPDGEHGTRILCRTIFKAPLGAKKQQASLN